MDIFKFKTLFTQIITMDIKQGVKDVFFLVLPYFALLVSIHLLVFSSIHTDRQINAQLKYRIVSIQLSDNIDESLLESYLASYKIIDEYNSSQKKATIYSVELNDYKDVDSFLGYMIRYFPDANYVLPQSIDMEVVNTVRVVLIAFLIVVVIVNLFILLLVISSVSRTMLDFNRLFMILGYKSNIIKVVNSCKISIYVICAFIIAFIMFYASHDFFNVLMMEEVSLENVDGMNINYVAVIIIFAVNILTSFIAMLVKMKYDRVLLCEGVDVELC